ncbi:MAG: DUF2975 domain-containing protein [Clostridia bacterium]|nr:DUF2975 domain-containing protein [Clostridia bacterium]MBQ5793742.1 DUF2975 domain-containing protein [Clostridia bacterium]
MKLDIKNAFAIAGIVACIGMLAAMILILLYLPPLVSALIDIPDQLGDRNQLGADGRHMILLDSYAMLILAMVCDALVAWLLVGVIRKREHTKGFGYLIFAIALCCLGEGLLSLLLVLHFQMALFVVCIAFALGLCMLIVRHLLAQAAEIKQENEFTI